MIVQSKQVLRRLISSIGYDVRCIKHEPSPMLLADNQIPFGFRHLLADYLHRKGSDDFFFIQVGAFDGIQCDPLYDYVQRHKWSGVLLEPQRKAFEQLTENYKSQPQLRLMNAAIAEKPGSCTLYTLAGEGLPPWCEGMIFLLAFVRNRSNVSLSRVCYRAILPRRWTCSKLIQKAMMHKSSRCSPSSE